MPYIKQEQRPSIDRIIEKLSSHILEHKIEEQDGMVNYAVTKLLHEIYPERYFHYNRAIGVLSCISDEFYRKKVGPYEDKKIIENGDVE